LAGVTLSPKGAKSQPQGGKLRSTGTKAKRMRKPPADLEQQLESCRRELAEAQKHLTEALEQQAATSEVLRVISNSPGELKPLFEAMLTNATHICGAKFGVMWLTEGEGFRSVAMHGLPPAHIEERQREPVIHPGP
jgi:hypothetical protein